MAATRARSVAAIAMALFVGGAVVAAPVLAGRAQVTRSSVPAAVSAPTTDGQSKADLGCGAEFIEPLSHPPHPPPLVPLVVTCTHVAVDVPPDVLSWNFDNNKTITGGNDTSMSSGIKFSFNESTDAAGNVVELTVHVELSSAVTNGGDSTVSQSFETSFNTNAAEVSVGGNLSTDAKGTDLIAGNGNASIGVDCGDEYDQEVAASGGGGDPPDVKSQLLSNVMSSSGECSVTVSAEADEAGNVRTNESGLAHSSVDLTVTAGAAAPTATPACAVQGLVTDGAPSDNHENPLPGIRVQLWQGGSPVGSPDATDATGHYCILAEPGVTDPGSYQLRATLIDAAHDPPLFETRYATEAEAAFIESPVTAADFGGPTRNIVFTTSSDQSVTRNLADVANIHWQSERFIDWVIQKLGVAPATFGHVVIQTFSTAETSYGQNTAFITTADSPFAQRNGPYAECPKNCEWHELGHHVAFVLGIAPTDSPPCAGRVPHGGWTNTSTCDSLQEGFPVFLPVLASLDLDAGRGEGYATTRYSIAGLDLANDDYQPWSVVFKTDGTPIEREDFAVAQLLWSLADEEQSSNIIDLVDPADPSQTTLAVDERVALGGTNLVHLLAAAQPQTVADVYDALEASPSVPVELKKRDPSYAPDIRQDISLLDEEFLAHGFYPVHDPTKPAYTIGDPISRTDYLPASTGLVPRRQIPPVPGAAIRLQNPTASPIEFTISLSYPRLSPAQPKIDEYRLTVPPQSDQLFPLEVAPYWRQIISKAADMPACGGPDQRLVTIRLSTAGLDTKTLDSCEYLHDVLSATDGAAVTFGGSEAAGASPTGPPGIASPQPAAPAPVSDTSASFVLVIVAGVVVLAIGALMLVVLRRRTRSP